MKKMKGVVSQYPPVYDDSKARFKHQSLLQDYQDLEKVNFFFSFYGFGVFFAVFTRSAFLLIVFEYFL